MYLMLQGAPLCGVLWILSLPSSELIPSLEVLINFDLERVDTLHWGASFIFALEELSAFLETLISPFAMSNLPSSKSHWPWGANSFFKVALPSRRWCPLDALSPSKSWFSLWCAFVFESRFSSWNAFALGIDSLLEASLPSRSLFPSHSVNLPGSQSLPMDLNL